MRNWTAVTPATLLLPNELALLVAPIRIAGEPRTIDGAAGHAEGVVLDEAGGVAGFLVRLSPTLVAASPRTLVPASAFTIAEESSLILAWPREKLLAQRRLEDDLEHYEALAAPAPGEGQVSVNETIKEGLEGSAVGAVVGGILGGIAGGPLLGFALAAFFATGGGLVGFISGGAQETRNPPPGERPDDLGAALPTSAFAQLARRLRDPAPATRGLVHVTSFSPVPAGVPAKPQQPSAGAV
jgi:hypothetical protein